MKLSFSLYPTHSSKGRRESSRWMWNVARLVTQALRILAKRSRLTRRSGIMTKKGCLHTSIQIIIEEIGRKELKNVIKKKRSTPTTTPRAQPTANVIQHRHSAVESSLQSEASLEKSSPLLRASQSSIVSYLHEWEATALFGLGAAAGRLVKDENAGACVVL